MRRPLPVVALLLGACQPPVAWIQTRCDTADCSTLTFSGAQSTDNIQDWTWTFDPASGLAPGSGVDISRTLPPGTSAWVELTVRDGLRRTSTARMYLEPTTTPYRTVTSEPDLALQLTHLQQGSCIAVQGVLDAPTTIAGTDPPIGSGPSIGGCFEWAGRLVEGAWFAFKTSDAAGTVLGTDEVAMDARRFTNAPLTAISVSSNPNDYYVEYNDGAQNPDWTAPSPVPQAIANAPLLPLYDTSKAPPAHMTVWHRVQPGDSYTTEIRLLTDYDGFYNTGQTQHYVPHAVFGPFSCPADLGRKDLPKYTFRDDAQDLDDDGVPLRDDCNDNDPAVQTYQGTEVPGDGVDQDCVPEDTD